MDPKQTSPLGNVQNGGQEGQPVQPTAGAVGGVSGVNNAPVFSTGMAQPVSSTQSAAPAPQKMAGDLGAENLSTGANVSRTMDSLNDANQSATGAPIFAKHKFDKIEYSTGDIILNNEDPRPKKRSLFGKNFSASRPKSAVEISREARREAKRLRKLQSSNNGTEPIVAANDANSETKSTGMSKGFKIGLAALVGVLVIIAAVLGTMVLTSKEKNTGGNSSTTISNQMTVEEAFTDYLSYLFYGDEEPSGDLLQNFEKTWEEYESGDWAYNTDGSYNPDAKNPIYAERMMETSSMTNPNRESYFEELNEKWDALVNAYGGTLPNSDLALIPIYFNDYAKVGNLSDSDIINIYLKNKETITDSDNPAIEEIVKEIGNSPLNSNNSEYAFSYLQSLENYYSLLRQRALALLNLVQEADSGGCLVDKMLSCNVMELSQYRPYLDAHIALTKLNTAASIRYDAFDQLFDVYSEIFKINNDDEDVE